MAGALELELPAGDADPSSVQLVPLHLAAKTSFGLRFESVAIQAMTGVVPDSSASLEVRTVSLFASAKLLPMRGHDDPFSLTTKFSWWVSSTLGMPMNET